MSTCYSTARICWNHAKCQAALYVIDAVVHMSVSSLTLVNHLSKWAFNRPLPHSTDTIHLHSHTRLQILLCSAQGCCHLLLKYIFGEYMGKKNLDKELGIKKPPICSDWFSILTVSCGLEDKLIPGDCLCCKKKPKFKGTCMLYNFITNGAWTAGGIQINK